MWNVQLINNKIIDRAVRILMEKAMISDYDKVKEVLFKYGNVQKALNMRYNCKLLSRFFEKCQIFQTTKRCK